MKYKDKSRKRRYQQRIIQALLLVVIVFTIWILGRNTYFNLKQQGIATGFDFLQESAGFAINFSLLEYSEQSSYGRAFLVGILNTLLVAVLGISVATILGFIIGIARLSSNGLLRFLAISYIETLRNIPLLLQIFFWYFAVLQNLPAPRLSYDLGFGVFLNIRGLFVPWPDWQSLDIDKVYFLGLTLLLLLGIHWYLRKLVRQKGDVWPRYRLWLGAVFSFWMITCVYVISTISFEIPELSGFNFSGGRHLPPELVALVLALSLYTASFIAEIVRSGIIAIPAGQVEAAYALGLNRWLTLKHVIIPQALRVIVPPLTSQYLNLTKNSSLAAAIAFPDLVLVFAGTVLNQTGQAVEVIFLTMLVYLTISLFISLFMNWYNQKLLLKER